MNTRHISSILRNEYSGIGMSIMKQDDGSFQVVSVNADSPAGLAGLGAGDVITAVDGEDITSMSLDEARKLIRSKMNGKFTRPWTQEQHRGRLQQRSSERRQLPS